MRLPLRRGRSEVQRIVEGWEFSREDGLFARAEEWLADPESRIQVPLRAASSDDLERLDSLSGRFCMYGQLICAMWSV